MSRTTPGGFNPNMNFLTRIYLYSLLYCTLWIFALKVCAKIHVNSNVALAISLITPTSAVVFGSFTDVLGQKLLKYSFRKMTFAAIRDFCVSFGIFFALDYIVAAKLKLEPTYSVALATLSYCVTPFICNLSTDN